MSVDSVAVGSVSVAGEDALCVPVSDAASVLDAGVAVAGGLEGEAAPDRGIPLGSGVLALGGEFDWDAAGESEAWILLGLSACVGRAERGAEFDAAAELEGAAEPLDEGTSAKLIGTSVVGSTCVADNVPVAGGETGETALWLALESGDKEGMPVDPGMAEGPDAAGMFWLGIALWLPEGSTDGSDPGDGETEPLGVGMVPGG
ncbi:LOW QUALITY PROTEIN: uncharacterized protein ColSpa_09161 [Colletotrichum spaethianum]|uniref:Uncharacterized protein n=1 Tax=Colletotrichum spaethianum TaxID=700344 RepID=A0AA37PB29_9PEZI|nr:LOW QUALITY PROTEIN: uncharacterized protein ColSpa_09161 [Colletotrichum spaethianum]GKT48980.1 LOW QUALITY PROTEIN: hypothetical protein ColSpa_09161 [Colletotrichum spaethianum]